jgi:hypothetical protein
MKKTYVMAMLAFALALTGCNGEWSVGSGVSYTFSFKVDNKSPAAITGIAFYNGSNKTGRVLKELSAINLTGGELSDEYTVSGFTAEASPSTHYCGVGLTFADGESIFGYAAFGHESKVLVTVTEDYWDGRKIAFSSGNW